MDELLKSFAEAIKKRTASSALGTYAFFWGVYHWQGIYTTFFVDQQLIVEKYGLLKNEYVDRYFFGWHSWDDWSFYLGYAVPVILVVIFIWLIPKFILIHAYKEEQKYKVDKRIVRFDEEKRIREKEKEVAASAKEALQAEIEVSDKRRTIERSDPTILWDKEYQEFERDPAFSSFNFIIESVYEYAGRTQFRDFRVPSGALAVAHSRGLIEIKQESRGTVIELTEKGKYFVGKYPLGR